MACFLDHIADNRSQRSLLPLLLLLVGIAALSVHPLQAAAPLEPAAALADFRLPPGYRIELVAAEPEIVDPVAIAFDAEGRLWVVEMRDYPTLAKGAAPSSRIRILEDRDADGRYESARTFADGLVFPTGLQLWRSGAFVTLAGEVAYFPDDDCDGRADRMETWYEGFATQNEQLRANHPTLAADGWMYVAGGLRGGEIKNHRRPGDPPLVINGRDFAFNPRTGQCRVVSGNGQFGLAIDDFGRRFTCSNRNPLIQVMVEQRYLQRNPQLVLPSVVHDVAAAGIESRLYPRSRALTTSAQHAGQFTAACGIEIYGGDAFVCEPTANLVHREAIEPAGATMRGRRVDRESEFLTATDEWFRPVNLHTGPDGALYVVDMYRAVIEHPEWMSEELRSRPDLRHGADRGRIYRIVAAERPESAAAVARIDKSNSHAMATALEHPNAWQRNLAVRFILESDDPPLVALRRLAVESRSPAARFLSLSLLQADRALPTELLLHALKDSSSDVREGALRLAEQHIGHPEVAAALLRLTRDPDSRVRYQAALSSMFCPSQQALSALKEVAQRNQMDAWSCRAVALAARDRAAELLISLLANADQPGDGTSAHLSPVLLRELATAVAAVGGAEQVALILESVPHADQAASRTVLLASAETLQSRGSSFAEAMAVLKNRNAAAHADVMTIFDSALGMVANRQAAESARIAASQLLRIDSRPQIGQPILAVLGDEDSPPPLKLAILDALRSQSGDQIARALLNAFPHQLPSVRRAIVDLLTSRPSWATELLAAAELDATIADEIGPAHRMTLMQHADAAVQQAAERLFAAAMQDREKVVNQYQEALKRQLRELPSHRQRRRRGGARHRRLLDENVRSIADRHSRPQSRDRRQLCQLYCADRRRAGPSRIDPFGNRQRHGASGRRRQDGHDSA
jgi:putative membrane-bound dehydrogenase-like protein